MTHFFVPEGPDLQGIFHITGDDFKHLKNVLRMRPGDRAVISDGTDRDYNCIIGKITEDEALLTALSDAESSELPAKIILYQGLPKGDKLELIIQKAVELGAFRIVPVEMRRSVVKLDDKKKASKLLRWNAIAKSAAEQSGRGRIPEVSQVMSLKEAIADCEGSLVLVPYENEEGMKATAEALKFVTSGSTVSLFIGPEGGFEPSEIELLRAAGGRIISLGRRILRTETAGIAAVSLCMMKIELDSERD